MDQLTEEKIGDKTNTYTYDKRGNRTSINGTTATFNTMNQMTSFGDEKITYDVDGNRTSDGKFDYNWDSLGQLIKLTNKSNNDTWYYQYDEQGRRITKTHNDTTVHYHYDNDTNHLIAESKDGKVIREYIRDQDGNLLGLKIGDQFYNYHKNYRGDIIGITDMSGNQLAIYSYDSWGNIVKEDVKDDKLKEQPFKYATYFFDKESDQYYLMARYYNPKHSVFLSVDPLLGIDESVGVQNGYNYADSSPTLKIDEDGKRAGLIRFIANLGRSIFDMLSKPFKRTKEQKKNIKKNNDKFKKFGNIYFTKTTTERMWDSKRFVPVQILKQAIKGKAYKDPQNSKGKAYYMVIYRQAKKPDKYGKYKMNKYNLKVIYNKRKNIIYHFHYERGAMGPLKKIQ